MNYIWTKTRHQINDSELLNQVELGVLEHTSDIGRTITALNSVSGAILKSGSLGNNPTFASFAFWLRKANISRLIESQLSPSRLYVPRGRVLHLAPSNVDTVAFYALSISLICGNSNVLRVPSEIGFELDEFLCLFSRVLSENDLSNRCVITNYPHSSSIERNISKLCDARLIWGGDRRVSEATKVPIKVDGTNLGFSNRYSMAVINSESYAESDSSERQRIVTAFCRDVFQFDQNACSSPRLLVWLGSITNDLVIDFHARVNEVIISGQTRLESSLVINKFVRSCELISKLRHSKVVINTPQYSVVRLKSMLDVTVDETCGGFMLEVIAASIEEFEVLRDRRLQTVSYYGLSDEQVEKIAFAFNGVGCYRIVPFGTALNFDVVWDGYELFSLMRTQIFRR